MWNILKLLLKKTIKKIPKKIAKTGAILKNPLKHNSIVAKGIIKKPIKLWGAISPKQREINKLKEKARLIENLVGNTNKYLQKASNYTAQASELVKAINQSNKFLKGSSKKEIVDFNKAIAEELKNLGIETDEDYNNAIANKDLRDELSKNSAYEMFMENWKNKFFAYDPVALGFASEEDMHIVWNQIMEDNTFEKVGERKKW